MNILIFSTAYLPLIGGAELAIKEITDRLPEHKFTLITARFLRALPTHERIGNVEVYRVGFGFSFDKWLLPFLGTRLAKRLTLEREPFSIIWSMMASQGSIAATRFKKAHPATKLVLTLQEGDEESHLKRYVFGNDFLYRLLIRPWHLLVFKRADVITAISEYLANRARQHSRAPVTVIPNGVDVAKFEARSTKSETNLKFKLGFKETDKIIVTASRLVTKNAVGDIIEALQHLPENLKLLIVGSGSLLENLQLTTYNLQLTGRVLFAGEVTHYELPSYLHISDIFVRPSRSEGMGSAFIEAMAAGLPVIATPVGGIPDFLFDPTCTRSDLVSGKRSDLVQTGLFVRVGDPQNIAEKVQLLLSNDDLRSRITENASKMVREKYDWNGIAKEMGKILETSADVK